MADDFYKKRGIFDEDTSGLAFREVFTPLREGPLPPRPRRSGKGGPSLGASNSPPVASASPVVTGTAAVGQTLTCSQGSWFYAPTSYAYQWLRDGANIAGATASTYLTVAADGGTSVGCRVTAANAGGSASATSNALAIAAAGAMPHRFWQLAISAITGDTIVSIAEIQFRTTAGVPLLFSGGTASASSVFNAGTTADKATDNDPNTRWSASGLPPQTWTYDYGPGNAKQIVEILIQARNDATPDRAPSVFTPQWSDDGITWTSMPQITAAPWTDLGQIQIFPVTSTATLFLYTGASNSGGMASNTGLSPAELAVHPGIQILNNTTLAFQSLQIGVNNLIGHQGITDNATHGSELGWALAGEAGRFPLPVFLVKAGQGGSQIVDWLTSAGAPCGYWSTLVSRYNTAVAALHSMGYVNVKTVVMYSSGPNDMAGYSLCNPSAVVVSVPTWVTRIQDYFANQMRPLTGATTPIIMTKVSGSLYPMLNGGIDTITAADSYTTSFDGDPTLWQGDGIHRTSAGYQNWAGLWLDNWLAPNGQAPAPSISPAAGNYPSSFTVTIAPVGGEAVYYSTDGSDPLTYAVKYTGPFTVSASLTVKARGIVSGKASSAVVANSYTISGSGGNSAQALAYLARTVGGNEGGNGANIAALIDGLVADGVWSKLDCLYVLAQQNATDAKLNLISTSYPLTLQSAPTFTSYHGYTGDNDVGLSTGFNPAVAPSPHLTPSSGNGGVWIYSGADAGMQLGTGQNFGDISITGLSSSSFFGYIFPNGGGNSVASPGTAGYFAVDRTLSGAGATNYYWNNSAINSNLGPASQAPNNTFILLLNGSSTTLSEAHFGASLGSAGQLAMYNRLRTYMTSIGVP